MYNAGSSTLFLALGAHYVCSHALVMLLLILQMVVAFLLYPFKFQELIRLKINAFLVSFPFMTKFCSSWLGAHDGFFCSDI